MIWLVRILNPLVWRFPGNDARKLAAFALAEDGSRVDLMQAATATSCPRRAASYIRHAADEARHAAVFSSRAADLRRSRNRPVAPPPRADSEGLFRALGEIDFLAFVHLGERRGRRQFEAYSAYFARTGDQRMRSMFDAILEDERRHESYTRDLLVELCGGVGPARAALRRASRWSAWRTWRRAGNRLAELVYFALMCALYAATMPFAVALRFLRPERSGWRAKE